MKEAYVAALEAAKTDPRRFESYALAALALHAEGSDTEAKPFIQKALARVPDSKRAKLLELSALINRGSKAPQKSGTPVPLDEDSERKLEALRIILQDADNAGNVAARKKLLEEFLDKSAPFVAEHPEQMELWTLRAAAALEIGDPKAGWEAGHKLLDSRAGRSADPSVRNVLARLEREGWLGDKPVPSLEEKRQGISGMWKCTDRNSASSYLHFSYSNGVLVTPDLGKARSQYKTDGSTEQWADGDCTGSTALSWSDLKLNEIGSSTCGGESFYFKTQFSLISDTLRITSTSQPDNGPQTFSEECTREATADFKSDASRAQAAADALVSFLKANSLGVSEATVNACNLTVRFLHGQENYPLFAHSRNLSVEVLSNAQAGMRQISETESRDIQSREAIAPIAPPTSSYLLQMERGGVNPVFPSQELANQALNLYKQAALLCRALSADQSPR